MFAEDAELLHDFVVESNEGLAEIESDLLAIEADGAAINVDLVNKVFRAIHSIKGAAGFLSLQVIEKLAHSMENVLSLIRNCELVPTGAIVDRLLKGADLLQRMLNDIENSNTYDVDAHVTILKQIVAGEYSGVSDAPVSKPSEAAQPVETAAVVEPTLTVDPVVAAGCVADGQHLLLYTLQPSVTKQARNPADLMQRLSDTGTILASSLTDEVAELILTGDDCPFSVIHATVLSAEQVSTFFELPTERVAPYQLPVATEVHSAPEVDHQPVVVATAASPRIAQTETAVHPEVAQHAAEEPHHETVSDAAPRASANREAHDDGHGDKKSTADANIRVSVAVLDQLMNLAGELVLGRNQLMQTIGSNDRRALESVASRLDQVTTELQEAIMLTRMQPVGNVLSKFTRVVRDLSKQLGKQVQLEVEGKDVELDKTIIESIGDPLTHLVRNAMDHGIERPDVRLAAGKPAMGTIHLAAMHQEGKVLLVIRDDGAGIDAARLRKKVVEKGLMTAEAAAALSEREAIALIFAPGFSTAEQITAVSGRGVGMDVVKTNFERLGGQVEIETEVGKGTTITVRLPLTLAIIPSLITSCGGHRYAIPQGNIRELVRVRGEERHEKLGFVNKAEVLRLRGELLPLIRLGKLVGTDAVDRPNEVVTNIVVVETGRLRYGLVVDRLHDSEEIVVKPLGKHLKKIVFLAGATILGDGRIAMILDAGGIARYTQLLQTDQSLAGERADAQAAQQAADALPMLLFTNHPNEQFGIPMSVVARIERIHADQIDSVAGQQVLQYRGATLTLLELSNCIQARPRADEPKLYIIVFRHGGRELGLIAPQVLDIRALPSDIDTTTFREPGVLGSAVLDGHPIRFLDAFELGNTYHAVGRSADLSAELPNHATDRPYRIVFAEDSSFFRSKVQKFLEHEGWEVVACEDGATAWDVLSTPGFECDLLLTDIEMPNMNGFELTQHVRRDPRWASLPIIAVTSLAGDADRAHGIALGVSDYMVKMNRDELITAVSRHLGLEMANCSR